MKKAIFASFCMLVTIFILASCETREEKKIPLNQGEIKEAIVSITPTENNKVTGVVTFTVVHGGVKVIADVSGLSPGKHGFHVHEHGDCSSHDASSAGGHFNPTHKKHGGPDSHERHVGDLGNLDADATGRAHYDRVDKVISLNGPDSIIGKSIVIHAGEDDLKTDPSGNSGARIGCGKIEVAR